MALYDFGYNLGIAQRLLPGSDIGEAIAIYRDVTERWNADQIRLLRLAATAAASGDRSRVRCLVEDQADRVRRLDDELRALAAGGLALVERIASRARGETVRAHARGRLISMVAFSAALAACEATPLTQRQDAGADVFSSVDSGLSCPDNLRPQQLLQVPNGCGEVQAEVTFDQRGVPGAVTQVDGAWLRRTRSTACSGSSLATASRRTPARHRPTSLITSGSLRRSPCREDASFLSG